MTHIGQDLRPKVCSLVTVEFMKCSILSNHFVYQLFSHCGRFLMRDGKTLQSLCEIASHIPSSPHSLLASRQAALRQHPSVQKLLPMNLSLRLHGKQMTFIALCSKVLRPFPPSDPLQSVLLPPLPGVSWEDRRPSPPSRSLVLQAVLLMGATP